MARHGTDMDRHGTYMDRNGTDMDRHGTDMDRHGTDMAQRHLLIFRTQPKLVSVPRCVELRNCGQPDVSHLISYA